MKKYTPTKEMRTNPLSKVDGGETITIVFPNHQVEYTNIKNVSKYLEAVISKSPDIVGYIYNEKLTIL